MKEMTALIGVSDTTLKRYEALDLMPPIKRTPGGQRRYDEIHLQGFKTLRSMLKGFAVKDVHEMFYLSRQGKQFAAFWIIARSQERLVHQKRILEENRQFVLQLPDMAKLPSSMQIGALAKLANVAPSAIRYWEERGLIVSERSEENGYRFYSGTNIVKTMIIPILRKTVYQVEEMAKVLAGLDSRDLKQLQDHYDKVEGWTNEQLERQIEGIKEFKLYSDMLWNQ